MTTGHELYMQRCIQLAKLGAGYVAPNPMVGAVLVYENRIIGEGYHQHYGQPHAEVNCINSVKEEYKHLISQSTIYVSLEPCAHYGKTPPCADFIIQHKIPVVVVGCRDPFPEVNGKGIEKLKAEGVDIMVDVLKDECLQLNKRFFTFQTFQRPYVILKWAHTKNGMIGKADHSKLKISNDITDRLVHKWRSEEQSIMVGTNTALYDDPSLNVRHWTGKDPVRLVVDRNLRLPAHLNIFNNIQPTIIFNKVEHVEKENVFFYKIEGASSPKEILHACYTLNIQSVIIEGGMQLTQSFIDEGLWDEARVIENTEMIITDGINAPVLTKCKIVDSQKIINDIITFFKNVG